MESAEQQIAAEQQGDIPEVDLSKLSEKERKRLERARRFGLDAAKPFEEEDASTYESLRPEGILYERRQTAQELEIEIKKLQDRQAKFGQVTEESQRILNILQRRLEFAKHKEAPKPILPDSIILPDAIYLYGVDYMSTSDIKTYFERFATAKEALSVNWINDSSCKVTFESDAQARKAYTDSSLTTLEAGKHSVQVGQAVVDSKSADVDPRNFDSLLGWKEALSYQVKKTGIWQKLWIRAATDKDVKSEETKGADSRYYQLQQKKKEKWMKVNNLYNPNWKKDRADKQAGNTGFIKKAIQKQERLVGGFNKRGRREDSDSSSEEEGQQVEQKMEDGVSEEKTAQPTETPVATIAPTQTAGAEEEMYEIDEIE